jgi:hypothetical protein
MNAEKRLLMHEKSQITDGTDKIEQLERVPYENKT